MPIPADCAPFLDIEHPARPDAVVCYKDVPLFAAEVVSEGNPEKTFNKAVYDAIEILRVCKAFDASFSTCHAMVLPTLAKEYNAILVTVRFEPFKFVISHEVLVKADVVPRVKTILKTMSVHGKKLPAKNPFPCLARHTADDCGHFGASSTAEQLLSHSSIIVKYNPWVYKYIPRPTETFTKVRDLNSTFTLSLFPHSEQKRIRNLKFNVFRNLQSLMTHHEARRCLIPLLKGVRNALEELHAADIAHLDLRLPNICFDRFGSLSGSQ